MNNRVYVVITAKDESETIAVIVRFFTRGLGYPVIVVDDGSVDATGYLAETERANVIRHDRSQGIARSLMEAWRMALDFEAGYIIQIDAGGSHDPKEANLLLEHARNSMLDVLIGSRFCKGAKYYGRPWRAFLSRAAAGLMNLVAHARIKDWSSGYRVYSSRAIESLLKHNYFAKMHAWQMEVVAWAFLDGLNVAEYPIIYEAERSWLNWKVIDESILVWLWRLFQ